MRTIALALLATIVCLSTEAFCESSLSRDKVEEFIQEWVAIQNSGAFGRYRELYAQTFYGIRRSGKRTESFDLSGWLKDRERMFRKQMSVSVSGVSVEISGRRAKASFRQYFKTGTYSDVGDKVILLESEGGRLKIAREEMLSSAVASKGPDGTEAPALRFAFVVEEGVVVPNQVDLSGFEGKPCLKRAGPVYVSSVDVAKNVLPPTIRSLIGTSVRIHSMAGPCETKVSGFKVITKEVPHQNQVQEWEMKGANAQQIAALVQSSGNRYLVATTEKCSGDFAKSANMPASKVFPGKQADPVTARPIKILFSNLPMYRKKIKPLDDEIEEEVVRIFNVEIGGKTTTWVSAFVAVGTSCGPGAVLGSLWQVIRSNGNVVKYNWVKYLPDDPLYATDVDDDGIPDFYYRARHSSYTGFISGHAGGDEDKSEKFDGEGNLFFEEVALHDDPC